MCWVQSRRRIYRRVDHPGVVASEVGAQGRGMRVIAVVACNRPDDHCTLQARKCDDPATRRSQELSSPFRTNPCSHFLKLQEARGGSAWRYPLDQRLWRTSSTE